MNPYAELSDAQLLEALDDSPVYPDPRVVAALMERPESLTEALLMRLRIYVEELEAEEEQILAEDEDLDGDPPADASAGGYSEDWEDFGEGSYLSARILCALREPRALPLIERLIRSASWHGLLEHWIDPDLVAYGDAALPMLQSILHDRSASDIARGLSTDLLVAVGSKDADLRASAIEILRAVLPARDADGQLMLDGYDESTDTLSEVAYALRMLEDEASYPDIYALYAAELFDEDFLGPVERFAGAEDWPAPPSGEFDYLAHCAQNYNVAAEANASDDDLDSPLWPVFANGPLARGDHDRVVEEPYRLPEPKIGRNQPCPCGSGRKYKQCCGHPTRLGSS